MVRFLLQGFIILVASITLLFVYKVYGDDIRHLFFSPQEEYIIYIGDVAVSVTVADTDYERRLGLSGVVSLDDFEGKLFIFDDAKRHGIWMKDMLFPIDILWLDENLKVIHIEEDIAPNTYPEIFAPDAPARFVLETNAYFVDALKLSKGDRINLPSEVLPADIKQKLQ